MKKTSSLAIVLSIISLLAASTGIAEPTHPNEVGLYTESGATGTTIMAAPVELYLVLTKPSDVDNGNAPFNVITGLEFQMHFNPAPNSNLIAIVTEMPPGSIDIGRYKDIDEGLLEFIVGIPDNAAVPVVNEAATLLTFTFFNFYAGVTEVTLHPVSDAASLPGQMVFLGGHEPAPPYSLLPMYSIGGSHDAPVFIFNGEAVDVESESFGTVKALYR